VSGPKRVRKLRQSMEQVTGKEYDIKTLEEEHKKMLQQLLL
jgi:hypothetical protein